MGTPLTFPNDWLDILVNDIIALGTDRPNNPPAPQNEAEAKQAMLSKLEEVEREAVAKYVRQQSVDTIKAYSEQFKESKQ